MNIQIFGSSKCFDTKKAERWFKERRIKYQYIDLFKKGGGEALAKVHNLPFLGAIPLDPATVIAADRGEPIVRMVEDTAAKRAFLKLAETVREKIGD